MDGSRVRRSRRPGPRRSTTGRTRSSRRSRARGRARRSSSTGSSRFAARSGAPRASSPERSPVDAHGAGRLARRGTGTIVDLQPPSGGWPNGGLHGDADEAGEHERRHRHGDVRGRDRRGQRRHSEDGRGLVSRAGGDDDPTNADDDQDSDGIAERQRSAAVHRREVVHRDRRRQSGPAADGIEREPDHRLRARARPERRAGRSPRACGSREIADEDVSTTDNFRTTAWTVSSGVGTAKFDRQKVVQYLAASATSTTASSRSPSAGQLRGSGVELRGLRHVFVQG